MKEFIYSGESTRILNCIGEDQIKLEIAVASSEEEQQHAVIALACNDELDKHVYLSPSQTEILIRQLEAMMKKANEINFQILVGEEPIRI
jgi:hypothetical protein